MPNDLPMNGLSYEQPTTPLSPKRAAITVATLNADYVAKVADVLTHYQLQFDHDDIAPLVGMLQKDGGFGDYITLHGTQPDSIFLAMDQLKKFLDRIGYPQVWHQAQSLCDSLTALRNDANKLHLFFKDAPGVNHTRTQLVRKFQLWNRDRLQAAIDDLRADNIIGRDFSREGNRGNVSEVFWLL